MKGQQDGESIKSQFNNNNNILPLQIASEDESDNKSIVSEGESGFEEESDSDQIFSKDKESSKNVIGFKLTGEGSSSNDDRDRQQNKRKTKAWNESAADDGGTSTTATGQTKNLFCTSIEDHIMRKTVVDSFPKPIPLASKQYSLKADMMFGWKPNINVHGAPIPLYFDYESYESPLNMQTNVLLPIIYQGIRFKDSLEMHKLYANKKDSYKFKLPPNMNVIDAIDDDERLFTGINPDINKEDLVLVFDSNFESGNLDLVAQVKPNEYDLYMRADSNTKGHHQWFNFSVKNVGIKGNVKNKKYFQVTFEYDFKHQNDTVYFSYCVPYTFTQLTSLIKNTIISHQQYTADFHQQFIKEQVLCKSLSGLEVPLLIVTSRINKGNYDEIDANEFSSTDQIPLNKFKKTMVICSRVHPGESNASYIMQGFIKFITSDTNSVAIELRKRIIFKIVPISNPDGVIIGNYRTSLSGNDLNRQFITPNPRLHPTVCAIKQLIQDTIKNAKEPEPISAFIDIHGHSRKKSMFIYGPHFPLHNEKYLKMRVLPQLLSEATDMFRFYSCKFRIQKSKLKAARVVLWKEFNIMNCFTLEASFHGFLDKDRQTIEFTTEMFEKMGEYLGSSFHEYLQLVEEDDKQHNIAVKLFKNKKKKLKAHDLTLACSKQQQQPVNQANMVQAQQQAINQQQLLQTSPMILKDKEIRSHSSHKDTKMAQQAALQKRAQSFNYKQLEKKDNVTVQNNFYQNQINANSNANNLQIKDSRQQQLNNQSRRTSIDNQDNSLKKPFRIKKLKQQSVYQLGQSVDPEKRTLREIYKKLKGDVQRTQLMQAQDNMCMEEAEDDYPSSCDGGDDNDDGDESRSDDDLSDGDMQQLQGDILNAIDKFNNYYNQGKVAKGQKRKTKKDMKTSKKNEKQIQQQVQSQIYNLAPQQIPVIKLESQQQQLAQPNLSKQFKNENRAKNNLITKNNKQNVIPYQQQNDQYSKVNNLAMNQHLYKQNPSQGLNQTNYNKFGIDSKIQSSGQQYQQNNLGVLYGEKMLAQNQSNNSNTSSFATYLAGNQTNSKQTPRSVPPLQDQVNALAVSSDPETVLYKAISHNIRNLFKHKSGFSSKRNNFGGTQKDYVPSKLQESKSQDRYALGMGITIMKNNGAQDNEEENGGAIANNKSYEFLQAQSNQKYRDAIVNNSRRIIVNSSKSSRVIIQKQNNLTPTNLSSINNDNEEHTTKNIQGESSFNQKRNIIEFAGKRPSTNNTVKHQLRNKNQQQIYQQKQNNYHEQNLGSVEDGISNINFSMQNQFKSQREKNNFNRKQPLNQEQYRGVSSPHSIQHENFFKDEDIRAVRQVQKPRRNIERAQQPPMIVIHKDLSEPSLDNKGLHNSPQKRQVYQQQIQKNAQTQNKNYIIAATETHNPYGKIFKHNNGFFSDGAAYDQGSATKSKELDYSKIQTDDNIGSHNYHLKPLVDMVTNNMNKSYTKNMPGISNNHQNNSNNAGMSSSQGPIQYFNQRQQQSHYLQQKEDKLLKTLQK